MKKAPTAEEILEWSRTVDNRRPLRGLDFDSVFRIDEMREVFHANMALRAYAMMPVARPRNMIRFIDGIVEELPEYGWAARVSRHIARFLHRLGMDVYPYPEEWF